jgi:hypothetical protein
MDNKYKQKVSTRESLKILNKYVELQTTVIKMRSKFHDTETSMFILFITVRFEIMTQTYVSNFIFKNYKFGFNGLQHGEGGKR